MRFTIVLVLIWMLHPLGIRAQMLGDLQDYPQLTINMHHWALTSEEGEGFSISWVDNGTGVKVKSLVAPSLKTRKNAPPGQPAHDVLRDNLPDSVVAPIFAEARALTGVFRFIPEKDGGNFPPEESIEVSISNPDYSEKIDLKFTRPDLATWSAAARFWNHLREFMPAPAKDALHEIP